LSEFGSRQGGEEGNEEDNAGFGGVHFENFIQVSDGYGGESVGTGGCECLCNKEEAEGVGVVSVDALDGVEYLSKAFGEETFLLGLVQRWDFG